MANAVGLQGFQRFRLELSAQQDFYLGRGPGQGVEASGSREEPLGLSECSGSLPFMAAAPGSKFEGKVSCPLGLWALGINQPLKAVMQVAPPWLC